MEKIIAKLDKCSTDTLKEMAAALMNNYRDGTDIVMDAVMDALMDRMDEEEFIAFADNL